MVPNQSVGTKTGDVIHVVTVLANGLRKETWFKKGMQVTAYSDVKEPLVASCAEPDLFPELSWIAPGNFQGVRKIAGNDCLIFSTVLNDSPDDVGAEVVKVRVEAVVDARSRLPVSANFGDDVISYSFVPPSSWAIQEVPPAVLSLMEARREQVSEGEKRLGRP